MPLCQHSPLDRPWQPVTDLNHLVLHYEKVKKRNQVGSSPRASGASPAPAVVSHSPKRKSPGGRSRHLSSINQMGVVGDQFQLQAGEHQELIQGSEGRQYYVVEEAPLGHGGHGHGHGVHHNDTNVEALHLPRPDSPVTVKGAKPQHLFEEQEQMQQVQVDADYQYINYQHHVEVDAMPYDGEPYVLSPMSRRTPAAAARSPTYTRQQQVQLQQEQQDQSTFSPRPVQQARWNANTHIRHHQDYTLLNSPHQYSDDRKDREQAIAEYRKKKEQIPHPVRMMPEEERKEALNAVREIYKQMMETGKRIKIPNETDGSSFSMSKDDCAAAIKALSAKRIYVLCDEERGNQMLNQVSGISDYNTNALTSPFTSPTRAKKAAEQFYAEHPPFQLFQSC
ncbi:unnamed protein product [Amoebophrya sp. A25]|nr:unnamed protein product [Amoebophrya sp. A25]|eukprot:GSA25T00003553001.1